ADSEALAKARTDSARAGGSQSRDGQMRPGQQPQQQLANGRPQPSDASRQDSARPQDPSQSRPSPAAGQRSSDEQLAERSRTLSKDVDQLSHRLADQQAQSGAQQVGAARQHVDSSAQDMSQRQAASAASQMDRA